MKNMDPNECIRLILQDIEKRREVDYGDKNSVRRYNAAMDRLMKNVEYFYNNYPDQMDMFFQYLDHPEYDIAATFTSALHHLHGATRTQKQIAIQSAKRLINHPCADDIARFAWSVNIQRWEEELEEEHTS